MIHVVTGRVTVVFATHEVPLGPGATLTFPGREPHTWRNAGDGPAEVLWVITPAAWSGSS